jgi:Ni/Fe-hydrogenase subunit HybB-like protein
MPWLRIDTSLMSPAVVLWLQIDTRVMSLAVVVAVPWLRVDTSWMSLATVGAVVLCLAEGQCVVVSVLSADRPRTIVTDARYCRTLSI